MKASAGQGEGEERAKSGGGGKTRKSRRGGGSERESVSLCKGVGMTGGKAAGRKAGAGVEHPGRQHMHRSSIKRKQRKPNPGENAAL